jgi:hypothetical protein
MNSKLFAVAALILAGCSGAQSPEAAPGASAAPSAAAVAPSAAESVTPSVAAAAPSAKPNARPEPTSAADCKALASDPSAELPEDPATAGPNGKSDRGTLIAALMHKKRPAFRCCFDVWAGKIPEARLFTKVAFTMKLDPTGKLTGTEAKPEEGGPAVASEVAACLADVAGQLTYPPSPSGKETTYTHHFDFKPHRRH